MKQPFGEMLLQRGVVNADQLRIALHEQSQHGQALGQLVIKLGFAQETPVYETLAEHFQLTFLPTERLLEHAPFHPCLGPSTIQTEQVLPLSLEHDQHHKPKLRIATSTPNDLFQQDRLRAQLPTQWEVQPVLVTPQALAQAIATHQSNGHSRSDPVDQFLQQLEHHGLEHSALGHLGKVDGQAIMGLVNAIIHSALDLNASDIHFEPAAHCLRIRLRIDGQMQPYRSLQRQTWQAVLVRLKVLGELDISETRQAQDGRMSIEHQGRPIDIRMSTLPTLHGENLVLRLLDRNKGILPLAKLGIPAAQTALLMQLLERPSGLILLTGPTGSGKTTTLYALLQHLQSDRLHIMTLEDPVEYALPGIQQTLVDPPRLDFAQGVRAMLRQDPDVLLIGEIRDEETAQMALRATQTGHQVFSTLHATDPFVALQRLQQLKIPLAALRGCLTAIINQRLIRKSCPECAGSNTQSTCRNCQGTGFRGRLLLLEILPYCHPALEPLLDDHHTDQHIFTRAEQERLANTAGWESLQSIGLQAVSDGKTTLAELKTAIALHSD